MNTEQANKLSERAAEIQQCVNCEKLLSDSEPATNFSLNVGNGQISLLHLPDAERDAIIRFIIEVNRERVKNVGKEIDGILYPAQNSAG